MNKRQPWLLILPNKRRLNEKRGARLFFWFKGDEGVCALFRTLRDDASYL